MTARSFQSKAPFHEHLNAHAFTARVASSAISSQRVPATRIEETRFDHYSKQPERMRMHVTFILAVLLLLGGQRASAAEAVAGTFKASDDAILHYSARGDGAPVVLLSGGPGFAGGMLISLAETVAKNNTAILLDQRGTGRSREGNKVSPETIKISRFVADVEDLRKALKADRVILLGHSWGGMLAQAYAAAHPEHVRGLVLLCSSGPDLSYQETFGKNLNGKLSEAEVQIKNGWRRRFSDPNDPDPDGAFFGLFSSSWGGYVHDRLSVAELEKHLKREYSHRDINSLMSQDMEGDPNNTADDFSVVGKLKPFKGPAFILFGETDPMDQTVAAQIKKEIEQAKIITVEKTGHYPWIERPDTFNKILENALRDIH